MDTLNTALPKLPAPPSEEQDEPEKPKRLSFFPPFDPERDEWGHQLEED